MKELAFFCVPTMACLMWVVFETVRQRRRVERRHTPSSKGLYNAYVALVGSLIVPIVPLLSLRG